MAHCAGRSVAELSTPSVLFFPDAELKTRNKNMAGGSPTN